MKKLLKTAGSLLLAAALLLGAVPFASALQPPALRIAVASDIHYRPPEALTPMQQANYLPGDSLFHHANTKGMLTYEADAVIDAFLKDVEGSGATVLLIPGDLSEEGYWEEHLGIAKKLRAFQNRTGIRVFVIPGNHDIRTSASKNRLDLADFLDVYADIGFDKALARHADSASYTAELDDTYRLLAIDACVYRTDNSAISEGLFAWIEQQVLAAKADGKALVGMSHFSVLEHFGLQSIGGNMLCVDQYRTLATYLADAGVKYVFTGHEHANDISHAVTQGGNKIFDVETGSLITYPNAWREVTFSDTAVHIATNYVKNIDTALLPAGFSAAQTALLASDFPAYSLAYFRAGFRSYAWLIPGLTETLAQSLELPEGSAAYAALAAAVEALKDAAELPFYDTGTPALDSVEELAKKGGITLAPSGYVNLLDLAGTMYAGHYAGNEGYALDSLEMRLLGQAINAVLLCALTQVPRAAVNALLAAAGLPGTLPEARVAKTLGAKGLYFEYPAKAFTRELVRTLGEGIFTDWSAPEDLNATLEPYGEQWSLAGNTVKITEFTFALDIVWRIAKTVLRAVRTIGM